MTKLLSKVGGSVSSPSSYSSEYLIGFECHYLQKPSLHEKQKLHLVLNCMFWITYEV